MGRHIELGGRDQDPTCAASRLVRLRATGDKDDTIHDPASSTLELRILKPKNRPATIREKG